MQKSFSVYFQSVIYSHHSSNWWSIVVLLLKIEKTHLCVSLLTHSLWIAYPLLPGVWKPGHAPDLERAHVMLHPQCHFISKCGDPVGHQQVAYCENHLDVIERHSIRWLFCYTQ